VGANPDLYDVQPVLDETTPGVKKAVLVIVTSDRGLCGGFNANVIKAATKWINSSANKSRPVEMSFVGRRGHDFFKNRKVTVGTYFAEAGGKVSFQKAKTLASALVERFQKGDVEEIKIIYNEFKNAATQEVVVDNFLPIRSAEFAQAGETAGKEGFSESQTAANYLVKPGAKEVFGELLSRNFSIQCFRILLESQAGEHGARMSAMENATKNAGEMIQSLTLQYNKQRQAGITKELLEIISGSESQKG
ncbi:MAG: ATP synthase F1 subunit gamma, partial [Bdellovibrionia bacterium]